MNLWQYAVLLGYYTAEAPLYDTARLLAGSSQSPTAGSFKTFQRLRPKISPESGQLPLFNNFFILLSYPNFLNTQLLRPVSLRSTAETVLHMS
jgi:hypothetical protein